LAESLIVFQQGKSKTSFSSSVNLIVSFYDSWSNGSDPDSIA
jgi:hypothetical protein